MSPRCAFCGAGASERARRPWLVAALRAEFGARANNLCVGCLSERVAGGFVHVAGRPPEAVSPEMRTDGDDRFFVGWVGDDRDLDVRRVVAPSLAPIVWLAGAPDGTVFFWTRRDPAQIGIVHTLRALREPAADVAAHVRDHARRWPALAPALLETLRAHCEA